MVDKNCNGENVIHTRTNRIQIIDEVVRDLVETIYWRETLKILLYCHSDNHCY